MKCPKGCHRCCEYIRVETLVDWDKEYCDARGIRKLDGWWIEIPHKCPHLKYGKCDLGNHRPQVCKDFYCERVK